MALFVTFYFFLTKGPEMAGLPTSPDMETDSSKLYFLFSDNPYDGLSIIMVGNKLACITHILNLMKKDKTGYFVYTVGEADEALRNDVDAYIADDLLVYLRPVSSVRHERDAYDHFMAQPVPEEESTF